MRILFIAMTLTVALSNYLVQFQINDWLTLGAFSFPFTFLITEICNRHYGASNARRIAFAGFAVAVVLSIALSSPRIACASGLAFLLSQLMDISVFNQLRQQRWWVAPIAASMCASLMDTVIFWNLAFYGEAVPLASWAFGDFGVKIALDLVLLLPYRLTLSRRLAA